VISVTIPASRLKVEQFERTNASQKQRNYRWELMMTATPEREMASRPVEIGARVMLSWLVLGLTLVAAVVAIGGWRRATVIWLVSALTLGAILVQDSIAEQS
jgi:hypothetical protein